MERNSLLSYKIFSKLWILIKKNLLFFVPVIFIIIAFFSIFYQRTTFVADYQDLLQLTMPYHFYVEHPFSLWNNAWLGGFPEYASPISDKYYPFSFPLYFLTKNIFFMNFIILLHLFIAYISFHKLGSLVTDNKVILLIFSLSYIFSGVILSRLGQHVILFALAWLPFVYFYFFRIIIRSETSVKNILFLSLCSSILFFTGMMYQVIFGVLILAIFTLYFILEKKLEQKQILSLLLAGSLFTLLTAIKWVPNYLISGYIVRVDPIDPLSGGGFLESNLASFIFGTSINSVYSIWESLALLGIVIIFLAIIGMLYAPRDFAIPGFFAIIFGFIWADGGNTLFSFIHLFPVLDTLRCPGRIFGAITPIILIFGMYGYFAVVNMYEDGKIFTLDAQRKKMLIIGLLVILLLKISELPFQNIPSIESLIALILIFVFVVILYFNRMSKNVLIILFSIGIISEFILLNINYHLIQMIVIIKLIILIIVLGVFLKIVCKSSYFSIKKHHIFKFLIIGMFITIMASLAYLPVSDPQLERSPASGIISYIQSVPSDNSQIWALDTGWPYLHIDFTYNYLKSGIHPLRAYYAYYLKDTPSISYQIGNTTYYTVDWVVDTGYLENGQQNINSYTYKIENISLLKLPNVLPNVFVLREGTLIPLKIEKFLPDEIVATGTFYEGDIVLLKMAFYPGWKINSIDADSIENMVGTVLSADTSMIKFTFEPLDYYIGLILTVLGLIMFIIIIIFKEKIDVFISKCMNRDSNNQ